MHLEMSYQHTISSGYEKRKSTICCVKQKTAKLEFF